MSHKFEQGRLLKEFSTFGIGGPARFLFEATSIEEMRSALQWAASENVPYLVVGKGSNTLFDDRGFDGLVIINRINFSTFDENIVDVGAGYSFALLGVQTARRGFEGLEFASGIPGSVGGAVYMNAGASGAQTADCLTSVTYLLPSGEKRVFPRSELTFAYRKSPFQGQDGAIVAARFTLNPAKGAREKQLGIVAYRTRTQPYGDKSCGCVFRNPDGSSAGALIQECGLKGVQVGGAAVSPLHANFIVNSASATAGDVLSLAALVKKTVHEKKGIDLEMELCVIPFSR